jgi:stalled ribosome rescue protein Dom34
MSNNIKVCGVWMDSKHAIVIATENRVVHGEFEIITTVECGDHEGADYKNEKVEHSKDSQEQKKYFKTIASHIHEDQVIYVFGPGKAQEQFKNYLEDQHKFKSKEITLGTSDKITNNEMIAKVKSFFEGK